MFRFTSRQAKSVRGAGWLTKGAFQLKAILPRDLSLAVKVNTLVAMILFVTMGVFVSLDYVEEKDELLRETIERLASVAIVARASMQLSSTVPADERLRKIASSMANDGISMHVVDEGAVIASSQERKLEPRRLRTITRRGEGLHDLEAWWTPIGLAVSIPYRSSSAASTRRIFVEGELAPVRAALRSMLRMHVVHGLVTVATMALGIAWALRRSLLQPLQRLVSAINVVERGTWEVDVPVCGEDEIGRLTQAFNKMGRNLAQRVQQVVQAEKLSVLALLAIQVGQDMDGPIQRIEESASRLGRDGYVVRGELQREVELIRRSARRARRAAHRLDRAFFEAFSVAQSHSYELEYGEKASESAGKQRPQNGDAPRLFGENRAVS